MEAKKVFLKIYHTLLYPVLTIIAALYLTMIDFKSAVAQGDDKGLDVDVNVGHDNGGAWYTNWWIWVIVILVFIIIIVAITNRGKRAD